MKTSAIFLSLISFFFLDCTDRNVPTQNCDQECLQELISEITKMAESKSCTAPADWAYTPIGSKACGGPDGYMAYPLSIDTDAFLKKVEEHKQAKIAFNKANNVFSNCMMEPEPKGIECADGKPVLVY